MANCYLQIGLSEYDFGDMFPMVCPMESLIPDTHEHLFRFLDYDLFRIEEPLKEFLSCLHDGSEPDKKLLHPVIKSLREMHPYFMMSPENVQIFLNNIFADYIISSFSTLDTAFRQDLFRRIAIKRYSFDRDPEEMIPESVEASQQEPSRRIVQGLFSLQDRIRRMVFIILDDTSESLANLPTSRRAALYSVAYSSVSLADIRASFNVEPSKKMRKAILKMDFESLDKAEEDAEKDKNGTSRKSGRKKQEAEEQESHDEKSLRILRESLDHLYWNPGASISPALREVILATTDVADPTSITYDVASFPELLDLEVYRMIADETHIRRCRNCRRYFVPDKDGQAFCTSEPCMEAEKKAGEATSVSKGSRRKTRASSAESQVDSAGAVLLNEEAPDTEVPLKAATPSKTKLSNSPGYHPYRKKYKTKKARVAAGTMTADEFDAWNRQAHARLELVADGKMDVAEYINWLNS